MMDPTCLIITSIASSDHPVLKQFAKEAALNQVPFIVIGDTKSPAEFNLEGCDFFSVERQLSLRWKLAKELPLKHYARKNLGYLVAMSRGSEVIIETDDDNIPFPAFWDPRKLQTSSYQLSDKGWVNVYKYFTKHHIWPRGFALEEILNDLPQLSKLSNNISPIQQGLADENPDIDAIYRLTSPLPIKFNNHKSIALGNGSWCPFNSQNTTWFKEAFALMYLPSYCSFRMTDIWRSFIAQRIAWTCGWNVSFHNSTVWQQRNENNLNMDFQDEVSGYLNDYKIVNTLSDLVLEEGVENISGNLSKCYQSLVDIGMVGKEEIDLVRLWIEAVGEFS